MNLARNALLLMILLTTGCMALVAGGVAAVGTYTGVRILVPLAPNTLQFRSNPLRITPTAKTIAMHSAR